MKNKREFSSSTIEAAVEEGSSPYGIKLPQPEPDSFSNQTTGMQNEEETNPLARRLFESHKVPPTNNMHSGGHS